MSKGVGLMMANWRSERWVRALGWLLCFIVVALLRPMSERERLEMEAEEFWWNKVYGKSKHDVVLMGDSRTYKGILPEILERYLPGCSVYNFGFSLGRINRQLLVEASKRLKPDGKRVLVFAGTPIDLINTYNGFFFDRKQKINSKFTINFLLKKMNIRIFNSLKERISFYKIHGHAFVHANKSKPSYQGTFAKYRERFTDRPFLPSDFSAFVDNLRWCQEQKIHVIAFRMVSCSEMDDIENRLSHCNFNQIKQAVLDHGFSWIERPTGSTLQSIEDNCYDASHLNESGAILFSHWLGKQLQKVKALR